MVKKILLVIALVASTLAGYYVGKMSTNLDLMDRNNGKKLSDVDLGNIKTKNDNNVINILLIGTDARAEIGKEKYGRSDTCMIATIDNKHKSLKLTSLMRDMYVMIPGYGQHKFNAAYSYGGEELLYKTIATNFGIKIDGYAEVNFSALTDIINKVDGVEVTLTPDEADYLNTTNYIKGRKNRNVSAGKNTLNGSQALGYCRIRKGKYGRSLPTIKGTVDDQGRTERQRTVMNGIFKKVKKMSMTKWMGIIKAVLPKMSTDLSDSKIISYATNIVTMGTTKINQFRIPVDGYYHNENGTSDGSVLAIDLPSNKQMLQDFIFHSSGKAPKSPNGTTTTESTGE